MLCIALNALLFQTLYDEHTTLQPKGPPMETVLSWLQTAPIPLLSAVLLGENVLIFLLALGVCALIAKIFHNRRTAHEPRPLEAREVLFTLSTILLNTAVTVAGALLWREGWVTFRDDTSVWVLVDVCVLFLGMDIAMYILHRVAHHPWLYPLIHKPHHRYENPRPLTLFVLHPAEALGFGSLWLLVLLLYDASWLGMSIYLALNVAFGAIGHLGVEPFPRQWVRIPVLGWLTTSTFHAEHHAEGHTNYGFYTLIWDRLFGTLHTKYREHFTQAASGTFRPPTP